MRTIRVALNGQTPPWGAGASLALHALLILAVLLSPATPLFRQVPDFGVAVDILTPRQFSAATEPQRRPETVEPSIAAPVPPQAPPESAALPGPTPDIQPKAPPGMIVATTMLSGKTLADPRSRQAVRELATFADGERVVQLCNLEAMDQVQAWRSGFQPDRLVAYARSNVKTAGNTIVADGGAIRSRKNWYDIKFKCEVAPDHGKVVAFEFQVGEPVPRAEWEELSLPPIH